MTPLATVARITMYTLACITLACASDASEKEQSDANVVVPEQDAASSDAGLATPAQDAAPSAAPSDSGVSVATPVDGAVAPRPDASTTDASSTGPALPDGPVDGDPTKPMVSVPDLPCGAPAGRATPATVKIGGRDVVIVYPCAHEGASVTFLFTLHGTLQEAQKVSFTLNAGPFHRLADSHNLIYALPKAVGTQWGREDNGTDLPHIMEVIDWVYTTFGSKFRIRSMWAQGGSWGSFYLNSTLACDERLKDRLKGVRMVVGGGCPRCSDRLSCIVGQQELELGMGMALTPEQREMAADRAAITSFATSKGCKGKMGPTDVGNTKYWAWPGCNPSWVYSYYLAPGEHAAAWDPIAIERTLQEMKSIE
jgi:hypothetical protein